MADAVRVVALVNEFIRRQQLMLSVLQHKINEDMNAVVERGIYGDGEGDRAPVEGSDQSGGGDR